MGTCSSGLTPLIPNTPDQSSSSAANHNGHVLWKDNKRVKKCMDYVAEVLLHTSLCSSHICVTSVLDLGPMYATDRRQTSIIA